MILSLSGTILVYICGEIAIISKQKYLSIKKYQAYFFIWLSKIGVLHADNIFDFKNKVAYLETKINISSAVHNSLKYCFRLYILWLYHDYKIFILLYHVSKMTKMKKILVKNSFGIS